MPALDPNVDNLMKSVVAGGYCVGCGACAALRPDQLSMEADRFGRFLPRLLTRSGVGQAEPSADPGRVCPFSDRSRNEDRIAEDAFPDAPHSDGFIGRWETLHAGYVREDAFRADGTSGGMTNWIAHELLARGLVDAVIHVRPAAKITDGMIFEYAVSHTSGEVLQGAKTRYHPVELSQVMQYVRDHPLRFAIVSLPCFARAVRLLRAEDPVIGERIRFQVALVCGHLKSTAYAQYYGWSAGVRPSELKSVDFRFKSAQAPTAKDYFIRVESSADSDDHLVANSAVFGTDWGLGFFKLKACDYCDDVLAETADITLGDAWLPGYDHDPAGTNIVIIRHPELAGIVADAAGAGRLKLDVLSAKQIFQSQNAGFRHRRQGLAYRLYLRDREGVWRPRKRVEADKRQIGIRYRLIFILRELLRDRSHEAFAAAVRSNSLGLFKARMMPLTLVYWTVVRVLSPQYWKNLLGRKLRRLRATLRARA